MTRGRFRLTYKINTDTWGIWMDSSYKAVLGMSDRVSAMVSRSGASRSVRCVSRANEGEGDTFRRQHIPKSDAFQDAMVKMLSVVGDYRGDNDASLVTYLHTVSRHAVAKSGALERMPCWAPKSPQHVEVLPKHQVVEFSTMSKPSDPAREYSAAAIKAGVDAVIDACAYPDAVREVLLNESSVRCAATLHSVGHAALQASISQVKKALKESAALRDML